MGCSLPASADLSFREEAGDFAFLSSSSESCAGSFSRSLPVAVGVADSIVVPGVLGVLADEPKDAKAPEPRPKAEEAPFVGEMTPVVVTGAMPLRDGLPPAVCSPPNRLVAEYGRELSGLLFSLLVLEVDREILLELAILLVSGQLKSYGA